MSLLHPNCPIWLIYETPALIMAGNGRTTIGNFHHPWGLLDAQVVGLEAYVILKKGCSMILDTVSFSAGWVVNRVRTALRIDVLILEIVRRLLDSIDRHISLTIARSSGIVPSDRLCVVAALRPASWNFRTELTLETLVSPEVYSSTHFKALLHRPRFVQSFDFRVHGHLRRLEHPITSLIPLLRPLSLSLSSSPFHCSHSSLPGASLGSQDWKSRRLQIFLMHWEGSRVALSRVIWVGIRWRVVRHYLFARVQR